MSTTKMLAAVVLLLWTTSGQSQDGNDFAGYSADVQSAYILGYLYGLRYAEFHALGTSGGDPLPGVEPEPERLSAISGCAVEMRTTQPRAIFLKYLEENPEEWHIPAAPLLWEALSAACP